MKRWLFAALITGTALACEAASFDSDFDEENKLWKEVEARIPAYPRAEDLIPFYVSPTTRHQYLVDGASLTVGEDGVVRYTLVLKTAGGATNVSYEGIRCATRERRLYAFGRPDNTWSRARSARWERIESAVVQSQHQFMLYTDFFCPDKLIIRSATEGIDALKAGIHPQANRGQSPD
ncbi:MAG: CNP1-like family protein [Betaproteobacteria bacterium]|nr:CNP1-like family protein [Betaproteobacteria bacterium]